MSRVALLCPGLGRVNRGYERFAKELFDVVKEQANIVLWKGAGEDREGEVTVGGWARDGLLCSTLGRVWKDRFFWEGASFGVKAWPRLVRGDVGVVHYSEPVLNSIFLRLEGLSRKPIHRLFSHALNMDPEHTLRCHHIHQVSPVAYEKARELGVPEDRMTLLPYGLHTDQFVPVSAEEKSRLREAYGVPRDAVVVLSVAALNRHHKRIDHLVRTISMLQQRCHLVLCGKAEDRTILDEAARQLGGAYTHLYVPPEKVREVYQLADLFVLPSLIEGFGLVVLEAALSGLPVLVHDSPHFRWMLGPGWDWFADMGDEATIIQALAQGMKDLQALQERISGLREELVCRFDWSGLVPRYLEMYERVWKGPEITIARKIAPC